VFASPFPPAECDRRLAAATTRIPRGGQLGLILAVGPRPTLVGEVSPSRVRVALPPSGSRGSYLESWFEGVINPALHGGTVVRGTAGPRSSSLVPARVISVILAVLVVIMTASGVASTISGSGPGPVMLVVPGFLTAFCVLSWAVTSRQTRSRTELLVGKLSEILEATATIEP
jgi:hypothetical protein